MEQVVYASATAGLLWAIWRKRAWTDLPVFCAWVAVSFVVALLPRHPESVVWRNSWFVGQQTVLLLLFIGVLAEFTFWVQYGMFRREWRYTKIGLFGFLLAPLPLIWFRPEWSSLSCFLAVRQYMQLAMLAGLVALNLYLWSREVPVPKVLIWHGWLLTIFCAIQLLPRITRIGTGYFPAPVEWQAGIGTVAYLLSAACRFAWACVILQLPWSLTFANAPPSVPSGFPVA